jgi:hypothetical protein
VNEEVSASDGSHWLFAVTLVEEREVLELFVETEMTVTERTLRR